MFGAAPLELGIPFPRVGLAWLLASPGIEGIARPFARQSAAWAAVIGAPFDVLTNVVDARNKLHIRWLRWLKFRFVRRIDDYGPERLPFYEFVRTCNV